MFDVYEPLEPREGEPSLPTAYRSPLFADVSRNHVGILIRILGRFHSSMRGTVAKARSKLRASTFSCVRVQVSGFRCAPNSRQRAV